ncbi:MAG: carboxy terminal-processing peptidase [Arachidicoccus sp.]|nr:carboxy terminal-processing peptidase [Arachidicoccus sp.]
MMSKKARPVFGVVLIGAILSVCACKAHNNDDTLSRQQQLLVGIGMILKQRHYSPKPIDNAFSENVFKSFLSQLDIEKNLFLQTDINSLNIYKDKLDDEMNGDAPMLFYPAVINIFKQRLEDVKSIYTSILSHSFDFTKDETYQPDADSLDYPKDAEAAKEAWRLRLKYRTLQSYYDLLNQKKSAKSTDSIKKKTDEQLQAEAREQVKTYYDRYFKSRFNPKTFDVTAQFSLYMNTITHLMDPHTDYFAPVDRRSFNEEMSNSFYGIGAVLGSKNGLVTIDEVRAGGAAWKSKKISVGDAILKVANGSDSAIDISGYETLDAVKLIRGSKGSTVTLTMKKASDGSVYVIKLVREEVKIDQARAKSIIFNVGDKKIGYINLSEFYADFQNAQTPTCSQDMADELKKLNNAKIDGLILDLQYNPGGSLQDVNKIIGYFVPKGPAVQVRDRDGNEQQLGDSDGDNYTGTLYNGPLIVMVNEFSASASEIFAAAMQDYHRAIIVGSTSTYGKGTVQNQMPLGKPNVDGDPEFGSLKMTIEKFYRINGGSTQQKGVASDIVLPDPYEVLKDREIDDPNSLPWDKINPARYTIWNNTYNKDSIVKRAQERINKDPLFNSIVKTNEWLDKNQNASISLNLKKYIDHQELSKKLIGKENLDSLNKDSLSVTVPPENYNKYYNNPDASTSKLYKDWLKSVSKDIFIKENVRIMQDMLRKPEDNIAAK